MNRQQIIDLFIDGMSCWHDNIEQLDFIDYAIKLDKNQKKLIKFLKDKIKEIDNEIKFKQITQQGNPGLLAEIHELRIISLTYQEVLDFVEGNTNEFK